MVSVNDPAKGVTLLETQTSAEIAILSHLTLRGISETGSRHARDLLPRHTFSTKCSRGVVGIMPVSEP
jgi:hypothetical protein